MGQSGVHANDRLCERWPKSSVAIPARCSIRASRTRHFYEGCGQTILAGQVWSGELVNRRKDGSVYDAALTISPVTDGDGSIQHFVAIKQDISERKATEERVQHLAHHDQLTDLPNRMLLSDRLFQAVAQARGTAGRWP
jgi:hypothetical protein